ncbi:MAG: hypothetical protein Q4D51_10135 [Eubacteriales bacterium]|nr:hypothetical protein [Eubacteriales bacterium]
MKKVDVTQIIKEAAVILVISIVAAVALAKVSRNVVVGIVLGVFILGSILSLIWFAGIRISIYKKKIEKRMNEAIEKEHLGDCHMFYAYTSIVAISELTGKIAYINSFNPVVQIIDAKDVTNVKSDYVKGPLGGTTQVYFQFAYNKVNMRIPTFMSNQAFSLTSEKVLTGISKADTYCEIIKRAQNENA